MRGDEKGALRALARFPCAAGGLPDRSAGKGAPPRRGRVNGGKVQDSVARLLRAPPYAARRKGLGFGYPSCLRSQSDRSTVVIGNCTFRTDNGGTSPGQSHIFTRSSILFRPHAPQRRVIGGAAGYRPRVRSAYSMRVYAHSPGRPGQVQDRRPCAHVKGAPVGSDTGRTPRPCRGNPASPLPPSKEQCPARLNSRPLNNLTPKIRTRA